jgi:hypothetical protein
MELEHLVSFESPVEWNNNVWQQGSSHGLAQQHLQREDDQERIKGDEQDAPLPATRKFGC